MSSAQIKQYLYNTNDSHHTFRFSVSLPCNVSAVIHNKTSNSTTDGGDLESRTSSSLYGSPLHLVPSPSTVMLLGDRRSSRAALFSEGGGDDAADIAIDTSRRAWSIVEDRLLLRIEETKVDPVATYATFHRANPVAFPKPMSTDPNVFRERTQALLSDDEALRRKMIQYLTEDQLGIEISTVKPTVTGGGGPQQQQLAEKSMIGKTAQQRALQQQQATSASLQPGGKKVYRDEDLILRTVVRQGTEQFEIPCCSEDITPRSPFLRELFQRSSDYVAGGARRIELSEKDPMWSSIPDMHNIFQTDNVLRFKQHCENPKLLERLLTTMDQLKHAEKQLDDEWDEFVSSIFEKRDSQLELLDVLKAKEVRSMKTGLQQSLKKDIATLTAVYDAHIAREEAKLNHQYDMERTAMEVFFERELATVKQLSKSVTYDRVGDVRKEANRMRDAAADVFAPVHLPRLLLLSDVLISADLRSNCLALMAADFASFVERPELGSELLRANTIRELLTLVTDAELFKAQRTLQLAKEARKAERGGPNSPTSAASRGSNSAPSAPTGIPLAFIDSEIKSRADARLYELSAMTLQQLQDLNRGVNRLAIRQRDAKQKQDERDRMCMMQQSMGASSMMHQETGGGGGGLILTGRGAGMSDAEQTLALARTASSVTGSVLAAARIASSAAGGGGSARTHSPHGGDDEAEEGPLSQSDMQRGPSLEERFLVWRDVLHDALNRKLHDEGTAGSVAHLRLVKGSEGFGGLTEDRRGFDVRHSFRNVTAESQGCLVVGESGLIVYWEARVVFVENGNKCPATVFVGFEPVRRCLSAREAQRLHTSKLASSLKRPATGGGGGAAATGTTKAGGGGAAAEESPFTPDGDAAGGGGESATWPFTPAKDHIVGVTATNVAAGNTPLMLQGVSWSNDGVLFVEGTPYPLNAVYDAGDYVGVQLNIPTGEVRLFRNGVAVSLDRSLPAWPKLRKGVAYSAAVTVLATSIGTVLQGHAAFHQVAASESGGLVSVSGAAQPPRVRCLLELEGKVRVLPKGSVGFAKAALPQTSVQKPIGN